MAEHTPGVIVSQATIVEREKVDSKPFYLSRSLACGPKDRAPAVTTSYAWWLWKADGHRPAVAGPLRESHARALLAELNGEEGVDG